MNKLLTDQEREQYRAACDVAVPGPWEKIRNKYRVEVRVAGSFRYHFSLTDKNATFIALSRTAGPALLAENDALRAKVERMEKRESIILGWFMNHDYECPPEMAKQPLDCIQGCPLCLRQWADSIIDEQAIKEGKTNE